MDVETDALPGTHESRVEDPHSLESIYRHRFDESELAQKRVLWQVVSQVLFQPLVPPRATVVDLGAGYCELINALEADRRIAVDLNPDIKSHAAPGVEVVLASSTDLATIDTGSVDVVVTSNFFEHLPDRGSLLETLRECRRMLVPGGRLVVLMPNIRYLGARFWDYFDHQLPLTHHSLVEAMELEGLEPERVVPRLLPYTVKDAKFTIRGWQVRWYLRFPPVWRVLGKQMFVVARAPSAPQPG